MQSLKKLFSLFATVLVVTGCQTIPYNDAVQTVVTEYALAADRHIVSMGTAWDKCYQAYDDPALDADRRFRLAKDTAAAVILATEIDNTGLTDKETLRRALLAVLDKGLVDKLNKIEEPFRGYLLNFLGDSYLDTLIKGIASRLIVEASPGQSEQDRRKMAVDNIRAFMFDDGRAARAKCTDGAFITSEDGFYDDWSSKLYAVQQVAKADDALGLCSKISGMVKEHADRINEEVLKNRFKALSFASGTECSLATIGGVLIEHENLRRAHDDYVILDRDNGKIWRGTIAQSVRIASTVEKFKKSASEDSDNLF
tara:strand:- start:750 stop:1685 length:936 start_codon:yes stop_codon:yes gene_type:complete